MKKTIRNIIAYVFLITSLAIFFHSVIPHDHHYNVNCDLSHHQQHNHSDSHPIHCHFFNEIIVDKAITTTHQKNVKFTLFDFALLFADNFQKINREYTKEYFPEQTVQIIFDICIENTPTRGSPFKLIDRL